MKNRLFKKIESTQNIINQFFVIRAFNICILTLSMVLDIPPKIRVTAFLITFLGIYSQVIINDSFFNINFPLYQAYFIIPISHCLYVIRKFFQIYERNLTRSTSFKIGFLTYFSLYFILLFVEIFVYFKYYNYLKDENIRFISSFDSFNIRSKLF